MLVYVTGPFESSAEGIRKRNKEALDLVCRRIILAKHIPICPVVFYNGYEKDPRLFSSIGWWVENVYKNLMRSCDAFCLIPFYGEATHERVRMEKQAWQEVGDGGIIMESKILNYLLGL